MHAQAKRMTLPGTLFAVKRFSEAIQELKSGYQPQLPLELALIEAIQGPAVPMMAAPASAATAPPASAPSSPAPAAATTPTAATPAAATAVAPSASPAAPAAETTAAGEPPPLDETAIRKLRARWQEFLKVIQERCGHEAPAALRTVRDIAIGEQGVAFAFGNNGFSRDMIAKPETLKIVASTLSEFLGRKVLLECQTGDKAILTQAQGAGVSGGQGDGPDALVEYAVNELGAQLVETSE